MNRDVVAGISPVNNQLREALTATKWLLWSVGTGFLALLVTVVGLAVALLCLGGIGLLLVRPWLVVARGVAGLERHRLTMLGHPIVPPYEPLPEPWLDAVRTARRDPATRRDLAWLVVHGTGGLVIGLFGIQAGVNMVRELTFPLWWYLLPEAESNTLNGLIPVGDWFDVGLAVMLGLVWAAVFLFLTGPMVRVVATPGLRLLPAHPDVDLSARITELTATRAAALDAHAVELRRIERALHDGAQNRLVGVAVLTGAARQVIHRDPAAAEAILDRAQDAAELALAELRSVVRGILPPILANRGLVGAVTALAGECAVECSVDMDVRVRCPVGVETTAYFAVAEALTNVSKHSDATGASVRLRRTADRLIVQVRDDGRGGVHLDAGSGLRGIRDRVAAHDGTTRVISPVGGPTTVEVELPCGS